MKPISILFLLCCLSFGGFAQPSSLQWEHRYGGGSNDVFHEVIEATNGYIIAVGETQSNTQGSSDGLLVIIDPGTGNALVEKRFGGAKADGLNALVQTWEGYFLLAGYTESAGQGKKDAWLLKIDERGNLIWETTFGSTADDDFCELLLLPDGTTTAIGQKGDGGQGNIWMANIEENKLLKEWQLGAGISDQVSAAVIGNDGLIVIAGNTSKNATEGRGDAFLLKTDQEGKLVWAKTFGDKEWEEAKDLVATADGGYALSGNTRSNGAGGMDMWLLKVNSSGFKQWEQAYGGKDEDEAHGLAVTSSGGYLLGGSSKSYHSGARSFKGYVVKTDAGGQRQWEWNCGGNKEDGFNQICSLHEGSVLVIGRTASESNGNDDAWILRFTDSNQGGGFASFGGAKASSVEHTAAVLKTLDGKLRPEERSSIAFTVFNQNAVQLTDLQVAIKQLNGSEGLQLWQQNYFGNLAAGEKRELRIPIQGTTSLSTTTNDLSITVSSGGNVLSEFITTVESLQPQGAAVEINNFTFEDSGTSDEETLQIVVHNPGDFVAQSVKIQFMPPAGIRAISPLSVTLPQLAPHGSKRIQFTYQRTASYRSASLAIPCSIDFGGQQFTKTLERAAGLNQDVFMVLTQPNETETNLQNIISSKGVFDVQVAVGSSSVLQQKNFTVLNNNIVVDGSKMDEVDLTAKSNSSNQQAYVYSNKIHLNPGENRLQIQVETASGAYRTKTIVIQYEPQQPNLHVLAIGPSHQDLSYTSKDAADFAAAFSDQGGSDKIFGQVFIRSMVTPEDTEASDIREAIADLSYQYSNPTAAQKIRDQDVLLVFISSHGKNNRDGFQLLPSNYDSRYERIRSIDFQRDIVQELMQIGCKKAIFIDACHSGAAESKELSDITRADALTQLAALHPGLNTMSSCAANEMSYEDAAWENGAFTEAILEAFANTTVNDANGSYSSDANQDNIITLAELYDFLRQRVPGLVRSQKPGAPTAQSPFMPSNEMDARQIPIYVTPK